MLVLFLGVFVTVTSTEDFTNFFANSDVQVNVHLLKKLNYFLALLVKHLLRGKQREDEVVVLPPCSSPLHCNSAEC